MQIKTTMRYHLPPIRISATKTKTENNKCWGGCGEIGTSGHRWWDCEMGQPLWKTVWHLHKKFKNSISKWPSNPTSGYLVKVTKSGVWERYLHTCVYNSIVHNSQEVELTQVSMDRRMNKHTVIYIFNTINVFSHKKDGNPVTCYHMDESWGHYAKWNKPGTKGQILYDSSYMKCLK